VGGPSIRISVCRIFMGERSSASIESVFRRLLLKLASFHVLNLFFFIGLSALIVGNSRTHQAQQFADSFRDLLVSGDTSQVVVGMSKPVLKDFVGAEWVSAQGMQKFSIPLRFKKPHPFLYKHIEIPVYFDEAGRVEAGTMSFYYPRAVFLGWASAAWFFLVLLSIPLMLVEKRRLIRNYELMIRSDINESKAELAAQVAHDIRSPLTALGAATKWLEIPADQRTLIDGAVGRMQAIANDLLHRYRAPGAEVKAKVETCALSGLIAQVIAEKRLQHKDKAGVSIEFGGGDGIKATVDPREFQRIISNLVNNAVEAFEKGGTVSVTLSALDRKALLSVKDDGKGIPPEILAKLCQKGETHGKAGGTGLGLYHAKRTVEEWGGLLTIKSEPGKGTAVTIELPRAARSAAPKAAVLLDDDPLVHMNWKMAAKAGGVELKSCRTRAELEAVLPDLPKDTPIFMDSDLGEGEKGEDIAKELHDKGFTDLTMATGHDTAKFAHISWLKAAGKEPPWA